MPLFKWTHSSNVICSSYQPQNEETSSSIAWLIFPKLILIGGSETFVYSILITQQRWGCKSLRLLKLHLINLVNKCNFVYCNFNWWRVGTCEWAWFFCVAPIIFLNNIGVQEWKTLLFSIFSLAYYISTKIHAHICKYYFKNYKTSY